MNTAIFIILVLIAGLALGTFDGWRTGYVDGQVQTQIMTLVAIKKYGTFRASTDTVARDRLAPPLSPRRSVGLSPQNRWINRLV